MYSTSCELGVHMKLFRLILNGTVKFCIVRCLCDALPIQNAVKRGVFSSLILNIVVGYAIRKVQEI